MKKLNKLNVRNYKTLIKKAKNISQFMKKSV